MDLSVRVEPSAADLRRWSGLLCGPGEKRRAAATAVAHVDAFEAA
ncbi:hypothetical protein [Rhodococcus sp. ABRD24]|nr:hypothetical protein [Rhodococcus sp. ABRD24]